MKRPDDLGANWKHLAAQRRGGELRLYVCGRLVAKSAPFRSDDFDLPTNQSLRIGSGEQDFFTGKIREVRLYRRALPEPQIQSLSQTLP
ncbi:MAG: LamG domain-containing protein [Planctomycetota bacterium]|nr:LamG domain-containing protein [Planctomycetota bacterium]